MLENDDVVLQTIVEHCADPQFNVTRLVEKVGICRSYLHELAYNRYGMSLQYLIETVRLEIAIKLIATDGEKIDLIRIKSGYYNSKTFRTAFKKRLNLTPQQCKEMILQANDGKLEIAELINELWKQPDKTTGDFNRQL